MTVTLFIALLTMFATITTICTESVKKILNELNVTYASNLLASIIACVVGIGGTAVYYILFGVAFTPANEDFSYTAEDLKSFFADKEIQNLILINPDNPSGNYISKADVLGLAEWCEKRRIRFILDEFL